MSLRRFAVLLLLSGCAARQPSAPTIPPHMAWVPEARARLGHVEDDALADRDAELERLRTIARFEIDTEDPDQEAVDALLLLHRFDITASAGQGDEGVRLAHTRLIASGDLMVGALMLRGHRGFEEILRFAPELLVERPEPVNRFLRSAFALLPDAPCSVTTQGFFIDGVSSMLECEGTVDERLRSVWGGLDPSVRTSLRSRGVIAPGDALTATDAAQLVDASFWGGQAYLHQSLRRGDVASAAHLARVLITRDPGNVPARLVLALEREIAAGVMRGDAETVRWFVHRYGPAYLASRFPESNVTKLVLLEHLAVAGLRQDFARVRAELSDASLGLLGPMLGVLDAAARQPPGAPVPELRALRTSSSPVLRAYGIADGLTHDALQAVTFGDVVWSPAQIEVMLGLDVPPWVVWWLRLASVPSTLRERLLERVEVPLLASRARRRLGCDGADIVHFAPCAPTVGAVDALTAVDLDDAMMRALERTPLWRAASLEALFARLDGGPVSARRAYVHHRIKALVFGGAFEEARRRMATDGRILSRSELLFLEATMLDAERGHIDEDIQIDVRGIEERLVDAIADGCPIPDDGAREEDEQPLEPDRVVEALRRTMTRDRGAPASTASLRPFVSRFEGRSRQTLIIVLALDALVRRDRASFDADVALAAPAPASRVAHLLRQVAATVFPDIAAPDAHTWIAESLRYRMGTYPLDEDAPRDDTSDTGPVDMMPDPATLTGPLADAYRALGRSPESAEVVRFLRTRATDDNARRVQCRVALTAFRWDAWIPGYLGVEPARERRDELDWVARLCRREPVTSRLGRHARNALVGQLPEPPEWATDLPDAPLVPEYGVDTEHARSTFRDAALESTPIDYGLARLTGMNPSLTLVLEGRLVDARDAATGSQRDGLRVRLLREDLEARRIDARAALALLWVEDGSGLPYAELFELLFEGSPRSKLLALTMASVLVRVGDEPTALQERRAGRLIAIAGDDVELLIHLADVMRRNGFETYAARAIARVRTLEPNARTTLDEDPACAPE